LVLWVHGSWFQKKNVYLDEEEDGMRLTAKDGSSFLVVTEEFVLRKEIAWDLQFWCQTRVREKQKKKKKKKKKKRRRRRRRKKKGDSSDGCLSSGEDLCSPGRCWWWL